MSVHYSRVGAHATLAAKRGAEEQTAKKEGDSAGRSRRSSLPLGDVESLPHTRVHGAPTTSLLTARCVWLQSDRCCRCAARSDDSDRSPSSSPLRSPAMATIKPNNRVFVYDSQQRARGAWRQGCSGMSEVETRGPLSLRSLTLCCSVPLSPLSLCFVPLSLLCVLCPALSTLCHSVCSVCCLLPASASA
jgi:hypothetical protein